MIEKAVKNNALIKLEHISLSYGKVQALRDVSLEFPAGKMICLIGPDGVGKSTLLSLITGAHALQDGGNLTVMGGDMRSKSHRDKVCPNIAYMPQGLGKNLYFTLTVEENMRFFAGLFGFTYEQTTEKINLLTKSTGLYKFLGRPAGKLSGGMKQKLGLCCSLIRDPDVLVLDEPTTGVDPLARRQFWDLIDNIRVKLPNMTVIVATAYMDEASRFEWIVAMNAGKILATGTHDEILKQTGCDNLDAAFIQLLPEELRVGHKEIVVPPMDKSSAHEVAIEAKNLTKRFGDFTAVDHVNFTIPRGEIFGFLGSNGCGKSTTMRMLTGLLEITEGESRIFGKILNPKDMASRLELGYMTQNFSLYNDLTVKENLMLCARLYRLTPTQAEQSVEAIMKRFSLKDIEDTMTESLPMGIKQRLSLAAAVVHNPKILILDEPTSGVDPIMRDSFWELIIDLSRNDKTTIFVTTHFMNEAERCDRISLMHAGKSLICDAPKEIVKKMGTDTLEEAFIKCIQDADPESNKQETFRYEATKNETKKTSWLEEFTFFKWFNLRRLFACIRKESLEISRDPIRLTLALFGSLILMIVISYGMTLDVDNLNVSVLDWDNSHLSRDYISNLSGSRYFAMQPQLHDYNEMEKRLKEGDTAVVIEIPAEFGSKVERAASGIADPPEIAIWLDGAMPSRAETIEGYATAMNQLWVEHLYSSKGMFKTSTKTDMVVRNRYNQSVQSLPAFGPAILPLLLLMIPAILSALSIVREKEMGSIVNLYVTPLSRLEFVIGKQIPYVVLSFISSLILCLTIVYLFDVPLKGSIMALLVALFIYCFTTTAIGLVVSALTKSQIAVILLTTIVTQTISMKYCGLINPVSSLKGSARFIGTIYPTTYMILISRGLFSKALSFWELKSYFWRMLLAQPVLIVIAISLLRKQEK
ncbi:MAG: ribosome-associated ATPase/putative transporter RbbA [Synergistaceae bacterium]|nr:ribosome-associated ATPase/putative transporter RbbA [Synergistaceae bacterium]